MKHLIIILFYMTHCCSTCALSSDRFVFLPPGLHFTPLKANLDEARIGLFKFSNSADMKIDIGNTIDLFGVNLPEEKMKITAGIDFMAYGYSVNSQGLRLQIDAMDGIFGGNVSVSKDCDGSKLYARLRILHLSGHFVDDHFYDGQLANLLVDRSGRMFTKDFGELVLARSVSSSFGNLRYYAGMSYATLIHPTTVERFAYLGGFELANGTVGGNFLNNPLNIYCAYQISLNGIPAYGATHQFQAGVKFGEWNNKGVTVYTAYLSGQHMFSEYYDERISTVGFGFMVDFF